MTAGVELPEIDLQALEAKLAAEQRRLLKLAMQKRRGQRRPNGAAAAKLLLYFSREMIVDKDVQEAIMDGMREIAAYVVNETLLRQGSKGSLTLSPLMFFHGVDIDYTETRKNDKNERVAMAAGFNFPTGPSSNKGAPLMSEEEFEYALTRKWTSNDVKDQKFGKEDYREQWPDMRERKDWPTAAEAVDRALVKYVETKHGASDKRTCRFYVSASIEDAAWLEIVDGKFVYPESWGR